MNKDFFPSSDTFEDVISKIVQVPPPKVETRTHVIHLHPRISATKLAEYVVADPARQKTIAKNAKKAPKVITIPYTRVRSSLLGALDKNGLNPAALERRAAEVEGAPANTAWCKDDNTRSASALRHLAKIAPMLDCKNAVAIPRPAEGWGHLPINGVRVSINPEVVFSVQHKGITKVGAIILNTGQDESLSLARRSAKNTVGDYLTALVYRMLEDKLKHVGAPLHTKCFAVDIFRDTIYTAPSTHLTLNKHMTAACEMIALRWDTIKVDVQAEEEEEDVFPS